jgi:hypothetical protein
MLYRGTLRSALREGPYLLSPPMTAYDDFLTLWKDADPDIPILITAKSEYAKLK